MQYHLHRSLIVVLALLPSMAAAHPGHSAFDVTITPHAGHSWEHLVVLCGAIAFLALAARAFGKGRR
jgi:hypothetical protein